MSKILTELLFKVDYISWCKWFLLLFNTHMINFGNTNTCKDAANLVLHVARLKAQHYARKSCTKTKIPPNSRKFYADFALIFWKTGKITTYLLSLNVWGLVRKILALKRTLFQRFHVKTSWNPSQTPFFPHSIFFSLFKGKAPKVLWEKSTSRPRKELRYVYVSRP